MTKQHFIALADAIREHNQMAAESVTGIPKFTPVQLDTLADFCHSQNPRFDRLRWTRYIAGECGPNGGTRKAAAR